jgi:hypothetical protein
MDDAYTDLASFGRFITYGIAIIMTIAVVILVGFGSYEIIKKDPRTAQVIGTVQVGTDCQPVATDNKGNTLYKCMVVGTFNVNNVQYGIFDIVNASTAVLKPGDSIKIDYNPSNPNDSVISEFTSKQLGVISIVIGVIILIVVWLHVYLVNRFKLLAAGQGAETLFRLF